MQEDPTVQEGIGDPKNLGTRTLADTPDENQESAEDGSHLLDPGNLEKIRGQRPNHEVEGGETAQAKDGGQNVASGFFAVQLPTKGEQKGVNREEIR